MATLTVLDVTRSGVVATPAAVAAGGDQFLNDGKTLVGCYNDHATVNRTFTFVTQKTVDGLAVSDLAVSVTPANDLKFVGPFPVEIYNDANGYVQMTYSDAGADMRVLVIRPL